MRHRRLLALVVLVVGCGGSPEHRPVEAPDLRIDGLYACDRPLLVRIEHGSLIMPYDYALIPGACAFSAPIGSSWLFSFTLERVDDTSDTLVADTCREQIRITASRDRTVLRMAAGGSIRECRRVERNALGPGQRDIAEGSANAVAPMSHDPSELP